MKENICSLFYFCHWTASAHRSFFYFGKIGASGRAANADVQSISDFWENNWFTDNHYLRKTMIIWLFEQIFLRRKRIYKFHYRFKDSNCQKFRILIFYFKKLPFEIDLKLSFFSIENHFWCFSKKSKRLHKCRWQLDVGDFILVTIFWC